MEVRGTGWTIPSAPLKCPGPDDTRAHFPGHGKKEEGGREWRRRASGFYRVQQQTEVSRQCLR